MFVTSNSRNILTIGSNSLHLYIIASLGVIFSLLSPDYIWIYIFSVIIISITIFIKEKFILFSILVLLLVFVGEINPTIRLVIQVIAILLLAFIALRKYGFDIKKYPAIPSPILSFIIFLYITLTISVLNSDFSFAAIPFVFRLSAFFVFVYLFFVLIKNVENVRLYINAIIFSAIVMAVGTLYDFMDTGFNLLMIAGEIYRTGGFIGNYNATGGYFAIAIPLLIASLYRPQSKKRNLLTYALIGLLLIALFITGSRSAFLASTISVSFILFIFNKKILIRITLLLVLSILVLLLIDPIREFMTLAFRVESGLTHRNHLWKISFDMIKENFFFGIGPGAYAYKMYDYFPVMLHSFQGRNLTGLYQMVGGKNSAHNFYLVMFTDLGILGFIASIMLPYIFFRISKTVLQHLKKSVNNYYYLVVGIVATMTGLLVRALFDGINIMSYGWISVDLPFWLMFSILIYFYNNIVIAKRQLLKVQ